MIPRPSSSGNASGGRLCMIVHGPYPIDPRVSREVRVALDERFEVDVIATRRAGELPSEVVDGARVMRLPVSHEPARRFVRVVFEYTAFTVLASVTVALKTLRRRYAIVHVNNPPDFLLLAALVPKLLGARVVFDIHDLSPDLFTMRFEGRRGVGLVRRLLLAIEAWATRFADAVVTVHEPYRQELVARGVPVEKTTVVLNGLDERLLPGKPRRSKDEGFLVSYHGTLTPHYGVGLLLQAAAQVVDEIPKLRVEIYGEGDALPGLRAQASALGLAERVHFSGAYLPLRAVLERVQRATVGVISNLPIERNRLALPTKLFEYVALGVPVVAADLPTIREHFSEDEILFFRAGDATALADALREVARDPSAASARAHAARERYEQYRWPVSAERYAAVLAGRDAARPPQ